LRKEKNGHLKINETTLQTFHSQHWMEYDTKVIPSMFRSRIKCKPEFYAQAIFPQK
jgi:hypothetical protein